ncbi:F-box protein At5g07610-like [Rhododendron vialii]|uniref:F-box protein At5g07610-like n=1 Tax=Rhododendron vialii TaxID=182163 RepID=UPI00265FEA60|nr:F-box protein At5g07610-like [Rhododendron vialii]
MSGKAAKAVAGSTLPKSSPAGREIANSDDLLAEILLLLPLKLLIRFKFVSKHWLSLISHPVFASNYSTRNPSSPSISGLYIYTQFRLTSVSFRGNRNLLPSLCFLEGLEGKYSPTTIQHSCNGLMLFDTRYLNPYGFILTLYIVCNPTTQNYRILPIARLSPRFSYLYRGAYLVFDPSKSPHYKVVVVSRYEEESFEIDVYSSETRSWKNIDIDVYNLGSIDWKEIFFLRSFSCSCGEAIYWLSYRSSLLKFDVHTEKMLTLPLPEGTIILPEHTFKYIGVCGGSLILIQNLLIPAKKLVILELDIKSCQWVTWVLKYRVDLRTIVSAFPEIEDDFKYSVLCFLEGEEKEDYSLVLAIPGRVISYNLNRRTFYVLGDLVPGELIYHGETGFAYPFVETLSPSPSSFPMGFGILELDKDYSGWSIRCWVNLRRLRSEFPEMASVGYKFPGFRVLYVLKGEKEKDFVVFLAIPGRIISYNLRCRTWDVLPGLRPIRSYIGGAYPFVGTLFPV